MTAPIPIRHFSEISASYDVVLSDVWGVIHNGREAFPEACAALAAFRAGRGPVILISNSPRPHEQVVGQLAGLKVPREAWTDMVTSGDATRAFLAELAPGPAWAIGPDRDAPLYEGLGLRFAGPEEAAFISCTGPYDDEVEKPEDYRARFALTLERDLEMICANPDLVVQRGDRLIYCGGALAELYAVMGGRVRMAGKPYAPIYEACLARAAELLGRPIDRKRVLCIGDAVATDLKGANQQGLDTLFVAGGIHGGELMTAGRLHMDSLQRMLSLVGAHAAFATPALIL
jgi:HAD superfamily hydrolase (TIGR01459 family)